MRRTKITPMLSKKRSLGQVTVELPLVLYVLFVLLFFPLLNLCTAFIRLTILYYANHNACSLAARGRSFEQQINGDPTAIGLAQFGLDSVLSSFQGVHALEHTVQILTTNIVSHTQSLTSAPLTMPADITNYTYQVQVDTVGTADPLITIPLPFSIPGLSSPLTATFVDSQYFENPTGLTY